MSDDTNLHSPVLPETEELEKFILGGCLAFGDQAVLECFGEISEADFFFPSHRALAKALHALVNAGMPVDPASVMLQWGSYGQGARPDQLIADAPDLCPSQGACLMAAKELAAKAARRRLILASAKSLSQLQDERVSTEEALAGILESQTKFRDVEMYGPEGLARLFVDETQRRYDAGGKLQGIATGFRRLDWMLDGLQKGELTVVGARPSQGKTAIALNIASSVAFDLGLPVLFISLEMSAYALIRRIAAARGNIPLANLRSGQMNEGEFKQFQMFTSALMKAPLYIAEAVGGMDSARISLLIRQHVLQHKVELVCVDYLQKIRGVGKFEKRTYEIGSVSGALKAAAVRNHVAILAPCQLNRAADDSVTPSMGHLADSSQIERDADTIALLHFPNRAERPQETKLVVAKQRDGACGMVDLRWVGEYGRFENAPVEE